MYSTHPTLCVSFGFRAAGLEVFGASWLLGDLVRNLLSKAHMGCFSGTFFGETWGAALGS